MKIENQVCSLELAQKLLTLGVKQNSLFYWANECLTFRDTFKYYSDESIAEHGSLYSAFTVAELGEMLPSVVALHYWLKITNWNDYELCYIDDNYNVIAEYRDNKEADARAKMLIYLLENGLMKL